MRGWGRVWVAAVATTAVLFAVTVNGSLQVLGTLTASIVDFKGASSTAPMKTGTSLPAGCGVGEAFFKADAPAGQNIYVCTSPDSWTPIQGGGGNAGLRPSSRYIVAQTDFGPIQWNQTPPVALGNFGFARHAGSQNLNNPTTYWPDATRSGVASISTTATTENRSFWSLTVFNTSTFGADGESFYARTDLDWEMVYIFRVPVITDIEVLTGLCATSFGDPPSCIGLSYRPAVTGSNFQWQLTGEGTWPSNADTGVPADTAWHKVKIRSDGTQTYKMWMSLDGGSEVSVCPSGCTLTRSGSGAASFHSLGFIVRTKAAEQKLLHLDYAHFYLDRGSER